MTFLSNQCCPQWLADRRSPGPEVCTGPHICSEVVPLAVLEPGGERVDGGCRRVVGSVARGHVASTWHQAPILKPLLPSAGVTPSHAAFAMHAVLVNHYIKGSFYPRGGSSEIAFHIIPVIQRAGGAVLTKASVHRVLLDSAGRACGEGPALCSGGTSPGPL